MAGPSIASEGQFALEGNGSCNLEKWDDRLPIGGPSIMKENSGEINAYIPGKQTISVREAHQQVSNPSHQAEVQGKFSC